VSESDRIKWVTSRDNPLLQRLRKIIKEPTGYRKQKMLWIEGDHLCRASLQQGWQALHAVVTEEAWSEARWRDLALQAESVAVVPAALMAAVSTLESPAGIGFVHSWPGSPEIRSGVPSLVLDGLQDAGNVGTMLRSARAFGFVQVVALKGTVGLWSPKVLRAGMGAHFGLHLVELAEADQLPALAVPLIGTSSHAPQTIDRIDLPWPCAWVFGHEGQGVSVGVGRRCHTTVGIPQPGGEESLNVGVAAGVCLYESSRQRLARA
jgi:TrmH family RNA methyltransferase